MRWPLPLLHISPIMEGRFSREDLREAEWEDLERLLVPSVSTLNLEVFSATWREERKREREG